MYKVFVLRAQEQLRVESVGQERQFASASFSARKAIRRREREDLRRKLQTFPHPQLALLSHHHQELVVFSLRPNTGAVPAFPKPNVHEIDQVHQDRIRPHPEENEMIQSIGRIFEVCNLGWVEVNED
jgi:hypothetical protein